jgi:hypothetical protein
MRHAFGGAARSSATGRGKRLSRARLTLLTRCAAAGSAARKRDDCGDIDQSASSTSPKRNAMRKDHITGETRRLLSSEDVHAAEADDERPLSRRRFLAAAAAFGASAWLVPRRLSAAHLAHPEGR